MPFTKNQIITLEIEALSNDGNGVAHKDGQAVFVPLTAPGDVAEVRIVKPMKTYAFGRVEKLLTAGPGRVRQDCPVAGPCGGCGLRHISYEAECAAKTQFVRDAFARLGKLDVPVPDVLGAPDTDRYRNKVQLPVGTDENGVCAVQLGKGGVVFALCDLLFEFNGICHDSTHLSCRAALFVDMHKLSLMFLGRQPKERLSAGFLFSV